MATGKSLLMQHSLLPARASSAIPLVGRRGRRMEFEFPGERRLSSGSRVFSNFPDKNDHDGRTISTTSIQRVSGSLAICARRCSNVSHSASRTVTEAAGINLINDSVLPPLFLSHIYLFSCGHGPHFQQQEYGPPFSAFSSFGLFSVDGGSITGNGSLFRDFVT